MEEIMNENTVETEVDTEKQEKFFEESKERMNLICKQLGYLEKIANKRSVDYTSENVEKMFLYLENQLADCKKVFMARFEESKSSKSFDFEF